MKMFVKYSALILLFVVSHNCFGQSVCETSNLNISTGYNQTTNSILPIGSQDNLWIVTSESDPSVHTPVPRPSNVIGVGGTISYSPYQTGYQSIFISTVMPPSSIDNSASFCGDIRLPVIFTYTFCVENNVGDLVLNMNVKADNMAEVYFNHVPTGGGSFIPALISPNPPPCPYGFTPSGTMHLSSNNFKVGVNTISIFVYSDGLDFWLNVSGNIISPSGTSKVLKQNCCVQNNSIAGKCFLDTYGPNNGIFDGTDGYLQNQTVYLEKEVSSVWTPVTQQNTNALGNYLFGGLAHGNYRIHQAPFNSFPLTTPLTNSGYHYITVGGNSIITGKNFGNSLFLCCSFNNIYTNPNPSCKGESTNFVLNDCFPNAVNTIYNYTWNYGDGSPAFIGLNASHTYQNAGTYNVSMQAVDPTGRCPAVTKSANVVVNEQCCPNCLPSFRLIPGRKYVLSAWVSEETRQDQEETFYDPEIWLEFPPVSGGVPIVMGPFLGSGNIIDGWQRIEDEFIVPFSASSVKIKLMSRSSAGEAVYFDDVRVHPFDAGFKSYVYDPVTLKFVAELDNNNYATFYEYDEEGKLVRVKKETERKTVTIKESRNSSIKRP